MKMISPIHQIFPLVPDTVPSPPSRVQCRRRSRTNGQLLARDEGTDESPKVTEGQLPRETELARNQITSSDVANGIVGILEWHTKDKNRLSIGRKVLEANVRVYRLGLRVAPEYFRSSR